MARTADTGIADRNLRMIDDYRNNRNQSYKELGARYGVGPHTARNAIVGAIKDGTLEEQGRKARLKRGDRRSISNLHVAIGHLLDKHCNDRILNRSIDHQITLTQVGADLGFVGQSFNDARLGLYDLTLTQLVKAAEWMGLSLPEMISQATAITRSYGKVR